MISKKKAEKSAFSEDNAQYIDHTVELAKALMLYGEPDTEQFVYDLVKTGIL